MRPIWNRWIGRKRFSFLRFFAFFMVIAMIAETLPLGAANDVIVEEVPTGEEMLSEEVSVSMCEECKISEGHMESCSQYVPVCVFKDSFVEGEEDSSEEVLTVESRQIEKKEAKNAGVLELAGSVTIGETTYVINSKETLVEADLALLRWQAQGTLNTAEISGVFSQDGQKITCNGYEEVYEKVYDLLLANANITYVNNATLPVETVTGTKIYKIEAGATVYLNNYMEVYPQGKIIFVSEGSATIQSNNEGRFTLGWDGKQEHEKNAIALQGRNEECKIVFQGSTIEKRKDSTPCFRLRGGNVYFNHVIIQNFLFGSTETGDAVIYAGSGYNCRRCIYMSNSSMKNISGGKSPGIFLRAYANSNDQNKRSELYFYKNTFENCKTTGSSNYAGGPVLRSFAADNCTMRMEDCTIKNNECQSANTASGGGAIYWKSAAGEATLVNCTFDNNKTKGVGGAIFNTGKMSVVGCTFMNNSADAGGGAIAAEPPRTSQHFANIDTNNINGSLVLDSKTVIQNNSSKTNGGALFFNALVGDNGASNSPKIYIEKYNMQITVDGATISNNTATQNGGAIAMKLDYKAYEYQTGILIKAGSVITNNTAINGNGGAIWMSSTETCDCKENQGITMSGGLIENNTAVNGGAFYISTGKADVAMDFKLNGGTAQNNTATNNGGAAYVSSGNFLMSGGNLGVTDNPNEAVLGGGVYVTGGSAEIKGGIVEGNTASSNGGGIYVNGGNFSLNGEQALIQKNTAVNGAGVYLTGGKPELANGSMKENDASGNGGGIYIDQQIIKLNPIGVVNIEENKAKQNGAGIYIGGTNGKDAGFEVDITSTGRVVLQNNGDENTKNGGAVCINNGYFKMEKDNIDILSNQAQNGGGVAVLGGDFEISAGTIGENLKPNTAVLGGGVYVSGGEATVSGKDGGVVYNQADYGGGIYVADGNVYIIDGFVNHNQAAYDGGGILVSANTQDVKVIVLSGSLSYNKAAGNGGGMAVQSAADADHKINVEIGCLLDHKINSEGIPGLPIAYTDGYEDYKLYQHESCPIVKENQCEKTGGGFYLNSKNSTLNFYCIEESGNKAADKRENCWGMDVEGGKVSIGDEKYHNHGIVGHEHSIPYGYIHMGSAILVNAGQVDIFGDMTNPMFESDVTVDIKNSEDHFIDHRRLAGETHYKVHYVENFLDPETQIRTGEYIARQYNESEKNVIIDGVLFIHEGYEIKGWYTEPDGTGTEYKVGQTYDLSTLEEKDGMGISDTGCDICGRKDAHLLKLYAIWEANGYKVIFDPNVPDGKTYSGTMEPQTYTYGVTYTLPANQYEYVGYIFDGWKMADGTTYADGATITNMTNQNGVEIVLYAQWKECTHPEHGWTYTGAENMITAQCLCGYKETAALKVKDAVYDGNSHTAEVVYSVENPKAFHGITLSYTGEAIQNNTTAPEIDGAIGPVLAGLYRAKITKNGAEATAEYTIAKAEQPKPTEKAQYTAKTDANGDTVLEVVEIGFVGKENAQPEYRLSYLSNGNLVSTPWKSDLVDGKCILEPKLALTNYYVEVRYEETYNYLPSDYTRADQSYFFEGNIHVTISCDEGIDCLPEFAKEGTELNGIILKPTLQPGYYLVSGEYKVTMTVTPENGAKLTAKSKTEFNIYDISKNCTIAIHIGITKKSAAMTAAAEEKQEFGQVTHDTDVRISRDSAFTSYFEIQNYDKDVFDEPKLMFSPALPVGSTVIMRDMNDGSYWYAEDVSSFAALSSFTKMGSNDEYIFIVEPELKYQFVVDFSRCDAPLGTEELEMTFVSAKKDAYKERTDIENLTSTVKVYLEDTTFELLSDESKRGDTKTLQRSFSPGGAASKWDDRAAALILNPKTDLPVDAHIRVVKNGETTIYYQKENGEFVIPGSELASGTKEIIVTLESMMFPESAVPLTYEFEVIWMVSNSKAGSASVNGEQVDKKSIVMDVVSSKQPALKIIGDDRVLTANDVLELVVEYRNMEPYTVEAELMRMVDADPTQEDYGKYAGTGWRENLEFSSEKTSLELDVPLAGFQDGNFCLMLTLKSKTDIIIITKVPYYFILR